MLGIGDIGYYRLEFYVLDIEYMLMLYSLYYMGILLLDILYACNM